MFYILTFLISEFFLSGGNMAKMITNITDYLYLPFRVFGLLFITQQEAEFKYNHLASSRQNSIPGRLLKFLIQLR